MKTILTSIAAATALALLSLAVPAVASAQTAQTARIARNYSTSVSQPSYVGYCISAIDDAVRDAVVDEILDKVLGLPKAAKVYDIYTTRSGTASDEAEVKYEWKNKKYTSVPFSVSRVIYDFLGLIPDTGAFWSTGRPATSCLEEAVIWDLQTGARIGAQLRKDIDKYLLPATPTGLTVRADPTNGTVLRLTWRDNANNEKSFQVSNGVVSRSAPAHAGTGAVSYTWTGLKPGSWTCLKVRATNVFGNSAWDPNATPWYKCASSSSPKPTKECVFLEPNQVNCTSSDPQITLEGENVGDTSGCRFSGDITWGDGSHQTVQYRGANAVPSFIAHHTYKRNGTFSIAVVPTVLSGPCTAFSGHYKFTHV